MYEAYLVTETDEDDGDETAAQDRWSLVLGTMKTINAGSFFLLVFLCLFFSVSSQSSSLCVLPLFFSLFGWFASVFSSSSLGFFCSSPPFILFFFSSSPPVFSSFHLCVFFFFFSFFSVLLSLLSHRTFFCFLFVLSLFSLALPPLTFLLSCSLCLPILLPPLLFSSLCFLCVFWFYNARESISSQRLAW